MRELTTRDLDDILNGACFLGSGGGGPMAIGQEIVQEIQKAGQKVKLADPRKDVGDDQTMAVVAGVGSPKASRDFNPHVVTKAAELLLSLFDEDSLDFVLPGEVGAGNTPLPMVLAVDKDIAIIDGAGAPRAMPSFQQATYATKGVPISPIAIADEKSKVSLRVDSPAEADATVRGIITSGTFDSVAGIAFWHMTGKQMKGAVIPGTTTEALNLGKTLREAKEAKEDPVEAVLGFLNASQLYEGRSRVLCRGKVRLQKSVTTGGFDFDTLIVDTDGKETVEIWILGQNENLIAWSSRERRPLAMAPDLICYLTAAGEPFSNAAVPPEGTEIVVIGVPAPESYRTQKIRDQYQVALQGIGYPGRLALLKGKHREEE